MDSASHGVWHRSNSSPLPHSVDRLAGPNSVGRSVSLQSAETGRGDLVGKYRFLRLKIQCILPDVLGYRCFFMQDTDSRCIFPSFKLKILSILHVGVEVGFAFFQQLPWMFLCKNLLRFQSLAKIWHVCLHSRNQWETKVSSLCVQPLKQVIKLYPGIPTTIICRVVPVKTVVLLFY